MPLSQITLSTSLQSSKFLRIPEHWSLAGVTALYDEPMTLQRLDDDQDIHFEDAATTWIGHTPALLQIQELYIFRNHDGVSQFLHHHPFLVPLLIEAHAQIEKYFDSDEELVLQVIADPENLDDRELYLLIGTALPVDEATKTLDVLDEEWWVSNMAQAQGKLCIDVDFL